MIHSENDLKECMHKSRVGWGKMSMVGQCETGYIFVSGVKAKELMITGLSVLFFLFQ